MFMNEWFFVVVVIVGNVCAVFRHCCVFANVYLGQIFRVVVMVAGRRSFDGTVITVVFAIGSF